MCLSHHEFEGVVVVCTVCGIKRSMDAAVNEGWLPNWIDRAGKERDEICPTCMEALGVEMNDDGECVIYANRAALPEVTL